MNKREKPLLRVLSAVVSNAHIISFVLIIAAVVGLLVLPLLDRQIKFDEKGLLAGLAHPTIGNAAASLLPAASRVAASAGSRATFQRPGTAAALVEALRSEGLTSAQLTHAVVLADPSTAPGQPPALCRCTNVHSRVRAPRGDGKESLAVVTPVAFGPQRHADGDASGHPASSNSVSKQSRSRSRSHGSSNGNLHLQTAEAAELALLTGASLSLHLARGPPAGTWTAGSTGRAAAGAAVGSAGSWLARDLLWVVPDLACGLHQCLDAWVRQYYGLQDPMEPLYGWAGARGRGASGPGCDTAQNETVATAKGAANGLEHGPGLGLGSGPGADMVRGGVIQQAVVLEVFAGASSYEVPELLVIGHEGLLPKLDMFYLLRYLFNYPVPTHLWRDHVVGGAQRAVTSWLQRLPLPADFATAQSTQDYLRRLLTGLHFAWHQAAGKPTASHAAFKDSMVDAATVRLVRRSPGRGGLPGSAASDTPSLALALAASLELSLRSLNNLVERVHHSSFLYVLTGLDRYVSVERYVGPAVALAAVLQLQAAWSMLLATRALSAAPHGAWAERTWVRAAARAATRIAFLAVAAAALRFLACQPLVPLCQGRDAGAVGTRRDVDGVCVAAGGLSLALLPCAAAALLQDLLRSPLDTPQGILVAASLALLGAGGAAAAASLAGRLAAVAVTGGDAASSAQETGSAQKGAGAGAKGGTGDAAKAVVTGPAGVPGCWSDGDECGWHAERTVVLTITAAAAAALVCTNWAAAFVAGAYLAPLALGQGLASVRSGVRGGYGTEHKQVRTVGLVRMAAWLAVAPFTLLLVSAVLASRADASEVPGATLRATVGNGVCGLSFANYCYAYVFALSFWSFSIVGSAV